MDIASDSLDVGGGGASLGQGSPSGHAAPPVARTFLDSLIDAGILIPTGVDGIYGRSRVYEAIAEGMDALITEIGADQQAEMMRFPPTTPRNDFEDSEYLKSFPQLAGIVHSFCGNDHEHFRLVARLERGEDWTDQLRPTRVVLTPAACYPVYPVLARRGPLPPEGRVVDVFSYCFRHEPSIEPTRMQMFRMREYVRLGTPEQILAFRQMWIERGQKLADDLEVPHTLDLANDPFFGRGGKLVADNQRDLKLKFELLIPVNDGAPPTACMSFNYHVDHFSTVWPLRTADGEKAHTGCAAFGIDRLTLALLRNHGLDLSGWPRGVRALLGGI
ncbi:Amino acid--[acyl-carrier-protein] ligase [Cupriavidus yeoncheonensis]|uniref:Amino acid--[acyl-carrier-protein] ligase n=1 Tax=Cupriavidus yeoncheonensis TaxID=1462994 RepID=A0A916MY79_9BURK|nr:amino acid--[acyl-carrier-protein] ligase [Cupriavidus yeoncheonensis]CAG2156961.1 Amino acid--[acyl-carrier-protein] ligase [Cupriavidus yeoncheonensis]